MIRAQQKNLIPFVMVGYPTFEKSLRAAEVLAEEGVEIIEVGLPFSDPLADGPVIQQAAEVALQNRIGVKEAFEFVRRLKRKHPNVQTVFFTYLNPILKYGLKDYVSEARAAGVDATLTVDLPPEEAAKFARIHREADLKTVFLASPTTTAARLPLIAEMSTGFVYYVARTGVTGEAAEVSRTLAEELRRLRAVISSPVAVGFGISTPEQAVEVARHADAVVIGSRVLRLVAEGEVPLRNFVRAVHQALRAEGETK